MFRTKSTRRTRSSRRGGRFVQKCGRLRERGGIFLPRRSEGAKRGDALRGGAGQSAIRNLQFSICNKNCLARRTRSSQRGGRFVQNGDSLREKSGRLWRRGETMKDMKSMKALKGGVSELRGVLFGEKGGRLREKGRCFRLHALHALHALHVLHVLHVLHGGGSLREKGGRLRLGRVLTAIPVSPGAMLVLSRAVPVLSRAVLVLCTAMPVRCSMKNVLFFPTNFPPLTTNQTQTTQHHAKLRIIIH